MAALLLWAGAADAGGRKRIVVLDFEGPKAEKFHEDLVKLIKKNHTVLSVDKWNEKAEELDASAITEKNVKKIAKKLKIDGVVTGKIEKRRDEYIIRLKLRSGTTGEILGNSVQTKAEGPRLDAQAQRDIKDELIAAIEELDSNRSGGGDEEEEADAPKKKKGGEEEEEDTGHKSGFGKKKLMAEDEESEDPKVTKKKKAEEEKKKKAEEAEAKRLAKEEEETKKKEEEKRKKDEAKKKKDDEAFASRKAKADEEEALTTKKDKGDEEEEEDTPKSKKRAKSAEDEEGDGGGKRKASADEDEEGVEEGAEAGETGNGRDLSVAGRAIDAVVGMSFTARRLKFDYASDLGKPPPGYKQSIPVAGAMLDVTFYPMAFSKNSKGIIRGVGLEILYDQVLIINSQKRYADAMGVQQIANLSTSENRWAIGPVLRYPLGTLVVGGKLTYGKQKFTVAQTLPNNDPTDIPNVEYTKITPAAFVKYPLGTKIVLNGEAAFHAITNTGQIQQSGMAGYGAATVTGFELLAGGDYMVTKNIFARAALRYEAISFKFKGDPTSQTNIRDTDPEQDVMGAHDTYVGGSVTVGYVY